MFTHQIDAHLALKLINEEDAEDLLNYINEDRDELRKWMAWADQMQTVKDELGFVRYARQRFADNSMLPLTIVVDGKPVGSLDLHQIDATNRHAAIGYWLSTQYQGQGIMTRSVQRLLTIGFDELNLHKIVLEADVNNHPSQAVAKRLRMHQDGILRDQIIINDNFCSLVQYSMLENEWENAD
ncbi:MAG TPA: hypothetical protein DCW31_04685 [Lactobacillus sp.]|nr:hypothetical protein [Lactobacillus sp.]